MSANNKEVMYNMKMEKKLLSLWLTAILTLCILNVAVTPTGKPTIVAHGEYITDAIAQQSANLTITAPAEANVNVTFSLTGRLTAGNSGIDNALVNMQWLNDSGSWITFGHPTTSSDGSFIVYIGPYSVGDLYFRVTYDGDSQYAPSVSDAVKVVVSK